MRLRLLTSGGFLWILMILLEGPEEAENFWYSLRRVVLCGIGLKSLQFEWLAVEVLYQG